MRAFEGCDERLEREDVGAVFVERGVQFGDGALGGVEIGG